MTTPEEEIDKIKLVLYGEDGTGGIVGCLKKKVSTRIVVWAFVFIGIPVFATGIEVWSEQGSDYLRYADKKAVSVLQQRVALCEERHHAVIKALDKLSVRLDKHCDEMKVQLKDINKDLKDVMFNHWHLDDSDVRHKEKINED